MGNIIASGLDVAANGVDQVATMIAAGTSFPFLGFLSGIPAAMVEVGALIAFKNV